MILSHFDAPRDMVGFVIPVLKRYKGGNECYVQTISPDGKVSGFAEFEGLYHDPLTFDPPVALEVGDEALWAFRRPDGAIASGDSYAMTMQLSDLLGDPGVIANPLLTLEIVDFCDLHAKYPQAATNAFSELAKASLRSAECWRDAVLFLPSIKRDLQEALPPGENKASLINSAIAVTQNGRTYLFFEDTLPIPITDLPRWRQMARPFEIEDFSVQLPSAATFFKPVDPEVKRRLRSPAPLKIILTDPEMEEMANRLREADNIEVLEAYGLFPAPVDATRAELIALVFFEDTQLEWPRSLEMTGNLIAIAINRNTRRPRSRPELKRRTRHSYPVVRIPSENPTSASHATQILELTNILRAGDASISKNLTLPPYSQYFRSAGKGVDPASDAFAHLFEQAIGSGADMDKAVVFDLKNSLQGRTLPGFSLLRASFSECEVLQFPEPLTSSMPLAAGLFELGREEVDEVVPIRAAQHMLSSLGWSVERPVYRGAPEMTFDFGNRALTFRVVAGDLGAPLRDEGHLISNDVTLSLGYRATASQIETEMSLFNKYLVSVRDLANFSSDALSIWPLVGHQLRRIQISYPSGARSRYYALVLKSVLLQADASALNAIWAEHAELIESATIICKPLAPANYTTTAIFTISRLYLGASAPADLTLLVTLGPDRADCSVIEPKDVPRRRRQGGYQLF